MSLIKKSFQKCKSENRAALLTYTVAGDNSKAKSLEILNKISKYADICELGFPHNTPIADGGQIQTSSYRAIKNGIKIKDVFDIVKTFKAKNKSKPIIIKQLIIPTSLTNEQITNSFADPRVINIYSIKEFISRLEASGYTATRHKLFFLTELSRPLFFTAMLLIAAMFLLGTESKLSRSIKIFLCLFIGFLLFSIQKIFESYALTEQVPLSIVAFGPSIFAILIFSGILLHIEDG